MSQSRARYPWRLWLLCLLILSCFYTPRQNSNVTTRFALSMAIVDRHALTIDPFADYTIDRAQIGPHFYADKAPGQSLLALPLVAALEPLLDLTPNPFVPPKKDFYTRPYLILIYALTVALVSAMTATAAGLLFRWCRMRGASEAGATFAAFAFALSGPNMWWSTTLFGHSTAAAFLMIGFTLLSESLVPRPMNLPGAHAARGSVLLALLGGLVLGAAFVVEFTAGPAVAIVAATCAADALAHRRPWPAMIGRFLVSGIGLLGPMLCLGAYNQAAFGSPLHLGYDSVQDFPGMKSGMFGISVPSLAVAKDLLVSQYRGLLPLAPVFLLSPFALVSACRTPGWRAAAVGGGAIFLWYWMMNSGYYYWWGGFSTGPRHLVPGLSLLSISFAPFFDRAALPVRRGSLFLLAVSVVFAILLAAIEIATPEWTWRPFRDVWWPRIAIHWFERPVTNLFGLGGSAGLLLIAVIWAAVGLPFLVALWRAGFARRVAEHPAGP